MDNQSDRPQQMSCRHSLANTTCIRCYPDRGGLDSNELPQIDPGPETDYGPNLDGPGAVALTDAQRVEVAHAEIERLTRERDSAQASADRSAMAAEAAQAREDEAKRKDECCRREVCRTLALALRAPYPEWDEVVRKLSQIREQGFAMAIGDAAARAGHARDSNPHPSRELKPGGWEWIHDPHQAWDDGWRWASEWAEAQRILQRPCDHGCAGTSIFSSCKIHNPPQMFRAEEAHIGMLLAAAEAQRDEARAENLIREEQVASCVSALDDIFTREGNAITRDDVSTYWRLKNRVIRRPASTQITAVTAERDALSAKLEAAEAAWTSAVRQYEGLLKHAHGVEVNLSRAQSEIATLRNVIVVRDPDTGGWECMACNRTAAYNDREGLEHDATCPLSAPAPSAIRDEVERRAHDTAEYEGEAAGQSMLLDNVATAVCELARDALAALPTPPTVDAKPEVTSPSSPGDAHHEGGEE